MRWPAMYFQCHWREVFQQVGSSRLNVSLLIPSEGETKLPPWPSPPQPAFPLAVASPGSPAGHEGSLPPAAHVELSWL